MKIDIIIVNVVLVAMVLVPFLIFILIGKQKKRELKRIFKREALKNNLKLSFEVYWNNNIFGLDKDQLKLLSVQERDDQFLIKITDLQRIKLSRVIPQYQNTEIKKNIGNVLLRVDLELTYLSGDFELFNLFHSDQNIYQDHELINAEKLNMLINGVIDLKPPTLHRAA